MSVSQQKIDDLNAIFTVKVTQADYSDSYSSAIKTAQKNAQVKGFRKGKVPMGLVTKMYGTSIKVDEINKLLNKKLTDYIQEEKLHVLGQPLPKQTDVNFEEGKDFEFDYEVGLAPSIEVKLDKKNKLTKYKVIPDQKLIDQQLDELRLKFGKIIEGESIEEGDLIEATVSDGTEDGFTAHATFMYNRIKSEVVQQQLLGKKIGEQFESNVKTWGESITSSAAIIAIEEEELNNLPDALMVEIEGIQRRVKADLNQELFDKVYGEGIINSEEELITKLKEEAESYLGGYGDNKFKNELIEYLSDKVPFELPNTFLKKWLVLNSEGKLTAEDVEKDFSEYEKTFRWQLIESKIIDDNKIDVSYEELQAEAKNLIRGNFAQYGQTVSEDDLAKYALNVLQNQQEARKLQDQIFLDKVAKLVEEKATIEVNEISFEDFIALDKKD